MPVSAYRTQPFQTTHENRAFDALYGELKRVWQESEELVVLLGNFYCQGSEIDAAVLKHDSISVIDFKDYEGKISFSENGRWYAGDVEVKGGNKRNPYLQIRDNKFSFLDFLKTIDPLPSGRSPNYGHISGIAVFHKSIEFDDTQVPRTISPWFHIVDLAHTAERLSQITSRAIDLSVDDIEFIVQRLAIPLYVPVGEKPEITAPNIGYGDGTSRHGAELAECLQPIATKIEEFINSESRALLVSGMVGTGAEQLIQDTVHRATSNGWSCLVLAPNRRMAAQYSVEADSLYSHIYSSHLRTEKEQLVYNLAENHDSERQIYLIGDCHLVSDSKFETDVIRFGSGQILTDLIEFANLSQTKRKIIFVGDPFQIARGRLEETALSKERVTALAAVDIAQVELSHLIPEAADDLFVQNCVELARVMHRGVFNQLRLGFDEASCVEIPHDPGERVEVVRRLISELPSDRKFVAFSHGEVNRLNAWIRKHVFNREGHLTAGDIIHIHNGFHATCNDDLSRPSLVPNDSFAEVISVDSNVDAIVQSLRGRQDPVVVPLLRVQARVLGQSEAVEFLALKDYLYSDKPEVDVDTLLALRVFAESRYRKLHGNKSKSLGNKQIEFESEYAAASDSDEQRAQFLLNDPYLNAARLRFGYALTLHRAQGRKFDTVIASLDTGQGQTNDAYFRWLYTLFTVPRRALYLSNVPIITPLSKASWDESRARLDSVRPTNLVAFDPREDQVANGELKFEFETAELRALYLFIANALNGIASQVDSIEHHNYQEVYGIRSEHGQTSRLRLFFNKRFQVTRIETVESNPAEFSKIVIGSLAGGPRFENELQNELYTQLNARFESCDVSVSAVDHAAFQEVYYLRTASGDVKLQIHYDGDGFVTRLLPVAYTNAAAVDLVRESLGF